MEQERLHPEATGELSNLLYDIALASKIISAAIRRAGLVNILGAVGVQNIQGEEQQKRDRCSAGTTCGLHDAHGHLP